MDKQEREELLGYADALERALAEIVASKRKAKNIPVEPIVRLIHFARTGSIRNATVNLNLSEAA